MQGLSGQKIYIGTFAKKCREYAEKFFPSSWCILSAKYGFLFPKEIVPGPYNVSFNDKSTNSISLHELSNQAIEKGLDRFNRIVVLGGRNYVNMVKAVFRQKEIYAPLSNCRGIGYMMGKLNKAIQRGGSAMIPALLPNKRVSGSGMIKNVIYLLTIIMGMWVIGELLMAEEKSSKFSEVKIILYQKGKQKLLDNQSPHFQEVLDECERLFLTADASYKLILHEELISQIKKKMAIEVIYPTVHRTLTPKPLYYTRLLIPLQGRFSDGTVFFAGIYEYELKRDNPDLLPEQNYSYIDQYDAFNSVVNTKGISKLKEILMKMSIEID